jgi:asparagine synthase (glutamine-hydrolysing)
MCGIFAAYNQHDKVTDYSLESALKALRERGPDGDGRWISSRRDVALGHTRLAIIGLNNGLQPIANEDNSVVAVVNGEFYDFERIRTQLLSLGHKFSTDSDSEIIVHLYEEHGVDCLRFLRGEFAFVLWDERKRRLFAGRDRFGIKPLSYSWQNNQLYLASTAKALFAAGFRAAWDHESVFHSVHMQYVLPDRSLFAGISQLRPGHFLLVQDGIMSHQCYFDLDYPEELPEPAPFEEAELIERFSAKFTESVRLRMRADTPICSHLSGGLDSSAILATAAKLSRVPIKAFSVSFDDAQYDEYSLAKAMAEKVNAEFHPVHVSQDDLIETLPAAVYWSEGLAVNGHLSAKFILNKEISKAGYKVALTGEGADEVLAGYAHLRSDLFRAQGQTELLAALHESNRASAGIMLSAGQSLSLESVKQRLGFSPGFLEAKASFAHKLSALLKDEFKAAFSRSEPYMELLDSFDFDGQLRNRHPVNQSLYLWSKMALSNYILHTIGDGTEMPSAVEGRVPFLDHELFELARSLPMSMKIKGTVEKYILREAARPIITDAIYRRQKHPFVAPPISSQVGDKARDTFQSQLRSREVQNLPFFEHKKLVGLLDRLPELSDDEQKAFDPVLMTVLSMSAMQQGFAL